MINIDSYVVLQQTVQALASIMQISHFLVECMNKTELIGASNLASLFCTPGVLLFSVSVLLL